VQRWLPLAVWGLDGQGVELCSRRKTLVSPPLDPQLLFLDHVYEFDPDQRVVGRCKRFESEHGTGDPFDCPMILFDDVVEIFDLADFYRSTMFLVVTLDGGFIGVTPVNRDRLRDPVPADRLLEKL
jgi:hypothetical protein